MYKIIISLLLVLSTGVLPVQGKKHKLPLLEDEVTRSISAQQNAQAWQQPLFVMQQQFKRVKTRKNYALNLPRKSLVVLSYLQEQTYLRRMFQVQKSIRQNTLLNRYTFVAPMPEDLVNLSLDNYALLHAFLKNLKAAQIVRAERVRPFTLSVQMKGMKQGRLELWIDEPTKKIYLMSNNLYSTAAGRYGLHLK